MTLEVEKRIQSEVEGMKKKFEDQVRRLYLDPCDVGVYVVFLVLWFLSHTQQRLPVMSGTAASSECSRVELQQQSITPFL